MVVETGLGPRNAEKVLTFAAGYAKGRRLYLTTTHFHPEHAFGAQVFAGEATYLVNRAQADDLAGRGAGYLDMFRGLGDQVARQLEGVRLGAPDVVYDGSCDLDLGGRVVHLRPTGQGHTKGDQVVTVPDAGVMFTGDLVETGQFSIFPSTDRDGRISAWRGRTEVVLESHDFAAASKLAGDLLSLIHI